MMIADSEDEQDIDHSQSSLMKSQMQKPRASVYNDYGGEVAEEIQSSLALRAARLKSNKQTVLNLRRECIKYMDDIREPYVKLKERL